MDAKMDAKPVYPELLLKMEDLLEFINTAAETPYGTCMFKGEPCKMTTKDECRSPKIWDPTAKCLLGPHCDDSLASRELVERMGRLLERVHAEAGETQVGSYRFEAGGKTFCLEMTPQESEVVGGVAEQC